MWEAPRSILVCDSTLNPSWAASCSLGAPWSPMEMSHGQASTVNSLVEPKELSSSVRSMQSPIQPGEMYQGSGVQGGYLLASGEQREKILHPQAIFPCYCSSCFPALRDALILGLLCRVRRLWEGTWRAGGDGGGMEPCRLLIWGWQGLPCALAGEGSLTPSAPAMTCVCSADFSPAPAWSAATVKGDGLSPAVTTPGSTLCLFQNESLPRKELILAFQ